MLSPTLLLTLICKLALVGAVTIYSQVPLVAGPTPSSASTSSAPYSNYTSAAAYDPTVLQPPPVPNPAPPTQFSIQLAEYTDNVQGLSTPLSGAFYGFSIEMSVIDQVLGLNGSFIQVPFLNLMSLIASRVGRVHIRVGGNTQETAAMVPSLPDGKAIEKQKVDGSNPTETPALLYTPEILYMLANISSLVNAKWYLGVPLNDSTNLRLAIAEYGEHILGDNLIGLQVGNEPDLYARHGHRPPTYGPYDYFGEFGVVVAAMQADSNISQPVNNLIGPSVATGDWTPEDVWNTGFITSYNSSLSALSVEHYPDDNCAAIYQGFGTPKDPQTEFQNYLNHTSSQSIVAPYINSASIASQAGKPFIMFETNTASCGGFPGISDSFGAALWGVDYGLQMAVAGFTNALLHVGGQDVYYNPFTPPPTNQTAYHQWTIGAIFYSVLAVSETLGASNDSQIVDLAANGGNMYTPGYAVYENGTLARVALINFVTDPSGASDYTAAISIQGPVPDQVRVKYLLAPSVSEKFNISWAGQTFGGPTASDGRLQGTEATQTLPCNQTSNTCTVSVPAPGFALVFLTDESYDSVSPTLTETFATTATIGRVYQAGSASGVAGVNPSVLATSDGERGSGAQGRRSTSRGSASGSEKAGGVGPSVVVLVAMLAGIGVLLKAEINKWP